MKFRYMYVPDDTTIEGYVEIPMLDVHLFYHGQQDSVTCLVDSGADECMFHSSVAENLGINLKSGDVRTYYPIGLQAITGYVHKIELQIQGFSERIQIEAGFTEESELSVLGQSGFFENYQITFRGFEKTFEIVSIP